MEVLLSIQKQKLKIDKLFKKATTLEHGIAYLQAVKQYIIWQEDFRRDHPLIRTTSIRTKAQLAVEKEENRLLTNAFTGLHQQHNNSKGWKPDDFTWFSWRERSPYGVLKKGGHYNNNGYPVYDMFYVPIQGRLNHYLESKPQGDAKGFYFTSTGGDKLYYFEFDDSEEEAPPRAPNKKRQVKKKHSTPKQTPPRASPVPVRAVGKNRTLLGREGHGLSRLLLEAKDPPVVEFKGPLEKLKSFRKRIQHKYARFFATTSTSYVTSGGPLSHRFLVEFATIQQRKEFLETCTFALPMYRLGSFDAFVTSHCK